MRKNKPTHIVTHHGNGTEADPCVSTQHQDVLTIDEWHKQRWPGFTSGRFRRSDNNELFHVGYHYVINCQTGEWTQTRAHDEEGAHCIGMNTRSIGVLFIGNYSKCSPDEMTEQGRKAWVEVYERIHQALPDIPIENIVPHRKYASYKDCHGSKLSDIYFQVEVDKAPTESPSRDEQKAKLKTLRQRLKFLIKLLRELLRDNGAKLANRTTLKNLSTREQNNYKSLT